MFFFISADIVMASFHNNRILTKTRAITRKWGIALTCLPMLLIDPVYTLEV